MSACCNRAWKWIKEWTPPLFVVAAVIGFSVNYTDVMINKPNMVAWKGDVWYHLGLFWFMVLGIFLMFCATMMTDPGGVPKGFPVRSYKNSDGSKFYVTVICHETKQNGCKRYCRTCKQFKPDRSHHCSSCHRCIRRMDHHCVFVNNCIGHFNYQYFMLFLLYISLAFLVMALSLLMAFSFSSYWDVLTRAPAKASVLFLVSTVMSVAIGGFFSYHVYLCSHNYSSIEFTEKRGHLVHGQPYEHPYHKSPFHSFAQVFGYNPLTWFLPIVHKPLGDALSFDVFDSHKSC